MPGRGPAPKNPKTRARRNEQNIPQREIVVSFVPQPALEDIYGCLLYTSDAADE